ncbi:hypothetical protein Pint_00883 [Pistacia integerrima]|uniref:Uncharacterized protein n=1 Tax=Pistacia integerrima TaxID=434235 RepID=A0ACC0ZJW0_9ROSI|nr:hypothetical protein Pint_00883 [Pistacia integerrima]
MMTLEKWPSKKTTLRITSLTRLTRTVSRSPESIGTLPPKGFMDPRFLRNQRYARKHNKKNGESAAEED